MQPGSRTVFAASPKRRRRHQFDADARRAQCVRNGDCAVRARAARQQRAGVVVARAAAIQRATAEKPLTSTSSPSVTPVSVARSTFFGVQLKLASHWNTISCSMRLVGDRPGVDRAIGQRRAPVQSGPRRCAHILLEVGVPEAGYRDR
ncbi:MAG: hypothetical protein IPH55_08515 [Betaproteobacteria bacterium]|nr:hypothetical protein [Betaproteobacteria bacterium]